MLQDTGTKSAVLQLVPSQLNLDCHHPCQSSLRRKTSFNLYFAAFIKKCDDVFKRIEFDCEQVCLVISSKMKIAIAFGSNLILLYSAYMFFCHILSLFQPT